MPAAIWAASHRGEFIAEKLCISADASPAYQQALSASVRQLFYASAITFNPNACNLLMTCLQGLAHRYNPRYFRLLSAQRLQPCRPIPRPTLTQSLSNPRHTNYRSTLPYHGPQIQPSWGPRVSGQHHMGWGKPRVPGPVASHIGPADYPWTANLNAVEAATPEMVSRLSIASLQSAQSIEHRSGVLLPLFA